MSRKVNDGKTAYERYVEKFTQISFRVPNEKAQEIRENAALMGISVNQLLLKCYEYFMNYGDATKL